MRRRFSVAAAALALSAALTVPAYAGTWKYVNDQWKYQRGTNKFAYNEKILLYWQRRYYEDRLAAGQ